MRKKEKLKLFKHQMLVTSLCVFAVVVAMFGGSYAFFSSTSKAEEYNVLKAGNLELSYVDKGDGYGDILSLNGAYPISDIEGAKATPYRFSIENTGSIVADFRLKIEYDESIIEEDGCQDNLLLQRYVKYKLDDGEPKILESQAGNNYVIYEKKDLLPNSSEIHEIRVWIDEKAPNDILGKHFHAKVVVESSQGGLTENEPAKIYGVKRSLTTSSTSWERTGNSVNLVANAQVGTKAVRNDFDHIYPWSDIISYNYDTTSQKITAYYGEDNFKFDGSNGEVFTYIPEFYYQRIQTDGYEYINISKEPQEGYVKSEAFSVGRYTMSGDATRVHSRSGHSPLVNTTITDFRTYARNLGEGFGQLDYHYFILQLLYLVEYADYNSQEKLGPGYTNDSHTGPINSGTCDILGMKSGSIDLTGDTSVIYRGIEDIFGNIWQFVDGINVKDNQTYICYDQSQYESDKFDGCYQALSYINANANGLISKLGYDTNHSLVSFPIEVSESTTAYGNDYYWQLDSNQVVSIGSQWTGNIYCGLWTFATNIESTTRGINYTARLLKVN